jgi:hypothetical protein
MEIDELCDTETKEPEPEKVKDALMYLKTPLTESSNLLRIKNNWKIIIGFELQSKFQRIIQLISIGKNHASCNPSEQEKLKLSK